MIYLFTKIFLIIIQYFNPVLVNGKNGVNGQIVIVHVPMVSVSVNGLVALVLQHFVTDPSVIWKSVIKTCVMIGRQRGGQIGLPGAIVQNHVVVVSESAVAFAKILIITVMIPASIMKWVIVMSHHVPSMLVQKNSGPFLNRNLTFDWSANQKSI